MLQPGPGATQMDGGGMFNRGIKDWKMPGLYQIFLLSVFIFSENMFSSDKFLLKPTGGKKQYS